MRSAIEGVCFSLAEVARAHATQRIVMFTLATRHEPQPSPNPPSPAIWSNPRARVLLMGPHDHDAGIAALALPASALKCPMPLKRRRSCRCAAFDPVAEDNEINALPDALCCRRGSGTTPSSPPMANRRWNHGWRPNPPALYDLVLMDIQMPQLTARFH
jgi:hypothetical protein